MTEARPALDERRQLYDRVGALLFEHHLDPTPENYAVAHHYLSGAQGEFAAVLAGRNAELSTTEMSRIADEAQAFLEQIAEIVGRSRDDAQGYQAALDHEAAGLAAGAPQPRAIQTLIDLTRAMIEKTRAADEHLQRTGAEIAALRDELAAAKHSANSDPLTGLPNRRAMDARLRTAIEVARRTSQPLSLVICDIDNFKAVNDLHGHQIGDEVIKFVASALTRESGERGFVARYGGEEFVLLFEGLDPIAAAAETDRLRTEVAARELKVTATGRSLGKVGLSAGVAMLDMSDTPGSLLKRADGALYRAKSSGRDRVCIACQED